jgi:signal peptidase II
VTRATIVVTPRVPTYANLRWLWLAVLVIVLDQLTKHLILASFRAGEELPLTPFASLVLAFNRGAAFSFLATAGGWQRWFFAAVTVVIGIGILWMLRRQHAQRLVSTALALVLGGALGNLWDRLTLGHVIDFLQLHAAGYYWPAFNVADSAITVGVVLLVWDSLRSGGRHSATARQEK